MHNHLWASDNGLLVGTQFAVLLQVEVSETARHAELYRILRRVNLEPLRIGLGIGNINS